MTEHTNMLRGAQECASAQLSAFKKIVFEQAQIFFNAD